MGTRRPAWGHGGMHGDMEACMGTRRPAWGHGGMHGDTEACMGTRRPAWGHGGLHGDTEADRPQDSQHRKIILSLNELNTTPI